jgi:hypothetical protein
VGFSLYFSGDSSLFLLCLPWWAWQNGESLISSSVGVRLPTRFVGGIRVVTLYPWSLGGPWVEGVARARARLWIWVVWIVGQGLGG